MLFSSLPATLLFTLFSGRSESPFHSSQPRGASSLAHKIKLTYAQTQLHLQQILLRKDLSEPETLK